MPGFRQTNQASTTARGYGTQHQKLRAKAIRELRDGISCCHFCGRPMWRRQRLALDHTDDRTGYRGLTHWACNQRDGARKGAVAANRRRWII